MRYLQELFQKYLGDDVILFTVDPIGFKSVISCGTLPSLFTTIDFGPGMFPKTKLGLYHIVMLRAIRKHSPQYRNISFHSSCLTFSKLYRNRPRSCIKNTEKISTKWSNGKHRILCWVDRQLGFTISEKKFNGDL
jgi:hypothetical protein